MKLLLRSIFVFLLPVLLVTTTLNHVQAANSDQPAYCSNAIIPCDYSNKIVTSIEFGSKTDNNGKVVTGNTNDTVNYILNNHLLPFIYTILGAAAVIMLILAGIRYITSSGAPDATKKARQSIINVMLGIALLAASYAVISLILGALQFIASKAT
jgi:hypothetical protein